MSENREPFDPEENQADVNESPDEVNENPDAAYENLDSVNEKQDQEADDTSYLERQAKRKRKRTVRTAIWVAVAAVICIPLIFFSFWAGTKLFFPMTSEVAGLEDKIAAKASKPLVREVTVTNPSGRNLILQRFDEEEEEWVGEAAYEMGTEETEKVEITFPDVWTESTHSTWRLCIDRDFGVKKYTGDTVDVLCRNRGGVKVKGTAAIVYCKDDDEILFDQKMNKELPNASTTKMMTAILALEDYHPDDVVTFSRRAAITPYAYIGIRKGYKFYMKDLMRAMLIMSCNECATAIGEHVGGSYEAFRDMMNAKVKELGLKHTHFITPSGLDVNGHYSTVHDIAMINAKAIEYDEYNKIMLMEKYKLKALNKDEDYEYEIKPTNELLKEHIKGYMGGKTGTTGQAGNCLSSAYRYKGKTYIIVVFNTYARFDETKKLMKYVRKYAQD